MALAIVQTSNAIHTVENPPSAVTLSGAPTSGNLLIALVGVNLNAYTVNTADWTQFDACQIGLNAPGSTGASVMVALYRYVEPGDTATLPQFFTAANTYWTHQIWEVSGVTGVWDDDFLCSFPLPSTESNASICPLPIFTAGLALTGTASYNGNSNPSISGSWSLDDAANNNSNYGSAAGAHRAVSNGDLLDGAWTQGSSAPYGAIVLILTTQQPTAGVYPRHLYRCGGNSGFTSDIQLPWAAKDGSLLVAYWLYGDVDVSPTITGDWTEFASAADGTGKRILSLYRYAQPGDDDLLPALSSAAGAFTCLMVVELVGAAGAFGTDHVSNKIATQASGVTQTTTSDLTTANNQFALLAYGNYNGSADSSTTGFAGYLAHSFLNVSYGSFFLAFKFFSSSGSTVQGTITPADSSKVQSYSQDIYQRGAGAVNANVNATGVGVAGAVGTLTPSVSVTAGGVASAGAATGPPHGIYGVSAAGVVGGITPSYNTMGNLVGRSAAGAVGALAVGVTYSLVGVSSLGYASPVDAVPEEFPYFPVISLMRDIPVPAFGAISDEPVACIGRVLPSGPQPASLLVDLTGVSASGHAATITPSRRVNFRLTGVSSAGTAGLIVPT